VCRLRASLDDRDVNVIVGATYEVPRRQRENKMLSDHEMPNPTSLIRTLCEGGVHWIPRWRLREKFGVRPYAVAYMPMPHCV
jgi:hypothetical protein